MEREDDFTVGVEEEFFLVDPVSRHLAPLGPQVRDRVRARSGDDARVETELHLWQVETATGVCRTLDDLRAQLVGLRAAVGAAAADLGCRLASAGTHPLHPGDAAPMTPEPAYLALEREYQVVAREQVVCGCHVHVGVADPEIAIQVLNRARPWLPVVRALAANSPFWMGADSGYASYRTEVWARWPTAGTPAVFESRADFDGLVDDLRRTGAIDDPARIYLDIRPSARFATLELRVADACTRVDESVMVAGLARALVRTLHHDVTSGAPAVPPRIELLRAANWRAARHGTEGDLIDFGDRPPGAPVPSGPAHRPAPEVVARMLEFVGPALKEAGEWEAVDGQVQRVLREGTGAARQRRARARAGRLLDVVDMVVAETAPSYGPGAPGGPGNLPGRPQSPPGPS